MPHMFPALIARGLSFSYPWAKAALAGVDLSVEPGEVHAVVGQSGAGKTLLADILGGAVQPSAGTMHVQGNLLALKNEQDAAAHAIRYAKQEWDLQSRQSVAEALELESVPRRFGLVDTHALADAAKARLAMYGLEGVDPGAHLCELSAGKQKLVRLAAVLAKSANLFILDCPTAALTKSESMMVFERLSQLLYGGAGILYFTSSAEEALEVGDKVSVLRNGALLATHKPDAVFAPQLEGEMLGIDLSREPVRPPRIYGPEVALRVEGLSVEHSAYGVGLKLRRSEIVGLLGLQGAGQSEIVAAIVGAHPKTSGEVFLRAAALPTRIKNPDEAFANRVGFLGSPKGLAPDPKELSHTWMGPLHIRGLSSKNPQRGPIAEALRSNCQALIFDEPTRGLSVADRLEVWRTMPEIADQGIAILAASTHVEELMSFCDRIAVVVEGRITRTVERADFSVAKLRAALKGQS